GRRLPPPGPRPAQLAEHRPRRIQGAHGPHGRRPGRQPMTDMTDDDERAAIRGELLAALRVSAPPLAAKLDDHWRQEGTTVQMPVDPVPRTCSVCGEKIKARAETSGRFRTVNWVDTDGATAGPDPIAGQDPYGRLALLADTDPAAYM